jgi:hypothetical protein
MDPNAALAAIRQAVDQLAHEPNTIASTPTYEAVRQFIEHFEALDEWLQRGGFMPEAWEFTDRGPRYVFGPEERAFPREREPLGPPNPAHGHLPEHDDA